jgi:predicted nucleotidyltransferase
MEIINITKSRLRIALLTLFFTNPKKSYYVRELERVIGFSAGNIRNELLKLEGQGLFLEEHQANLVYFRVNQNYPLFQELKSIIFKISGVKGALEKIVSYQPIIDIAFIYGSFAKKQEKINSDIDLFIIGNPDIKKLNISVRKLEQVLQREINWRVYSKQEIQKNFKNSGFLQEVFKDKKIFLKNSQYELSKLIQAKSYQKGKTSIKTGTKSIETGEKGSADRF